MHFSIFFVPCYFIFNFLGGEKGGGGGGHVFPKLEFEIQAFQHHRSNKTIEIEDLTSRSGKGPKVFFSLVSYTVIPVIF